MSMDSFLALKKEVTTNTGFVCYENVPESQICWYGTSDKFDEFKELVEGYTQTGAIAVMIDTKKKYMYSLFKNAWYEM